MSKDPLHRRVTRVGKAKYSRRDGRKSDLEDLPERENMKRTTTCGNSFSAITRFLISSIGQHWNTIYHKLCEDKSDKNWIVLKNIKYLVYTEDQIDIKENKVYFNTFRGYCELRNNSFYLNNGILYRYKRIKSVRLEDPFSVYGDQISTGRPILSIITIDNLKFDIMRSSRTIPLSTDIISYAIREQSYDWNPWKIVKGTFYDFSKIEYPFAAIRGPFKANYE